MDIEQVPANETELLSEMNNNQIMSGTDRHSQMRRLLEPTSATVELIDKIRRLALEIKAKISGEQYYTFEEAVKILRDELKFPEDRATSFVKRFDKNKDGRLSVQEFDIFRHKIEETKTKLVPKFQEYDQDGNNFITLEEASVILQKPPFEFPAGKVIMLLKQFDRDGNGKLDIHEFAAFFAEAKATHEEMASEFDRLDKDGNGVLSPEEVVTVIREMMGFDAETAKWMVQMFDQNQDGSLDKQEFMQMWTSMFGK